MFELESKLALVTGASQGIGREVALRLAAQGARVVVAARSVDKLEELAHEIVSSGGEAFPLALDVGQAATVAEQLERLPKEIGDVEILVNNAGITRDGLLARMSLEQWEDVLRINLTGTYAVTRQLVRGMIRQRWGRIVLVSSVVGLMGNAGQANYAASKAGMIGFAKSMARELGGRSITVNVVAPGYIETAMTGELGDKVRDQLEKSIVLRRLGKVEDVAAAVAFLSSPEAGYITGEVLNVSGGMYI